MLNLHDFTGLFMPVMTGLMNRNGPDKATC